MVAFIAPNVRNITRVFRKADMANILAGAEWYADANRIAEALADKYGVTVDVAAGVLAAVSPNNGWGANVNLAGRVLAQGGTATAGYFAAQLAKANAIIGGADIAQTLGGDKTINFARAIATAGREGVVIDRHAYDIATNTRHADGTRPTLKGKRYALVADAYVRAAAILSAEYGIALTSSQVQSVTWVEWRAQFWARGAFDAHAAI